MFSKNAVICYNLDTEENMNKQGFTLTELLITVVIVGILVSIALPMYTRTIERSRATEAMAAIKAMNDSIYAFFIEREACPTRFSQLAITVEDANDADNADNTIETKFFRFDLAGSPVSVPGTDCNGILATRIHGGNYQYQIWNPYTRACRLRIVGPFPGRKFGCNRWEWHNGIFLRQGGNNGPGRKNCV